MRVSVLVDHGSLVWDQLKAVFMPIKDSLLKACLPPLKKEGNVF